MAAERKLDKYSALASKFITQPVAVQNFDVFNEFNLNVLVELGRRLCDVSAVIPVSACICCDSTIQFRDVA